MPPPFFRLNSTVTTKVVAPARICLGKGYKKIALPVGKYHITEIPPRNEAYWHVMELSDGYTYILRAIEHGNPYYSMRISIWQNDLADAVYGAEEA